MSTFDKIDTLLKEQGKKQIDLCNYLGIGKNRYTDWKAGRIKSYTKFLPQIAEFFNVSVDYILGAEEKKPVHVDEPKEGSLHPEQRILLSCYSKISDDDRKVLWTLLNKYLTANEKEYFSQSDPKESIS